MICEFRGKLELRNFSLIESSRVPDLFRDKNADTETDMEQIGAHVAKEQEQITADGGPTWNANPEMSPSSVAQ
jgi:hypothetical protein